jgi:4-oxalocrotonate tautomerase
MPFVNIRLNEGRTRKQKAEIARRVVDAVSEIGETTRDSIWVTFDDISADDWYVADQSVADRRKQAKGKGKDKAKDKAK